MWASAIAGIGTAIANVFGWLTGRSALKNSPAVQKATQDAQLQAQIDEVNKHVADGDIGAIRKDDAQ